MKMVGETKKDQKRNSSSGMALIWVVILALGVVTLVGVGGAVKKSKELPGKIPKEELGFEVLPPASEKEEKKTPRLISDGPCVSNLDSQECKDFVRQKCGEDPFTADCLEAFDYAGTIACETEPESKDCQLYQTYQDQVRGKPQGGQEPAEIPKELEDLLNQIRTDPTAFLPPQIDCSINSYGPGCQEKYHQENQARQEQTCQQDPLNPSCQSFCLQNPGNTTCQQAQYQEYLHYQNLDQLGQLSPYLPEHQRYQDLQQQYGQPEPQPVYINPLNNPNFNPMANPNFNPLMNPNFNPMANPNINPMANPSLNPGCIPCQISGQQPSGPYGQWGNSSGYGGGTGAGGFGGWGGGGFGGWGR